MKSVSAALLLDLDASRCQLPKSQEVSPSGITLALLCCLVLYDYQTHLLLGAAPCSAQPGASAAQNRQTVLRERQGEGCVCGCLMLELWLKPFPAMWDVIKMMKYQGNIALRLTAHMLPAATQMNLGAWAGARHLNPLAFVSSHPIIYSTDNIQMKCRFIYFCTEFLPSS